MTCNDTTIRGDYSEHCEQLRRMLEFVGFEDVEYTKDLKCRYCHITGMHTDDCRLDALLKIRMGKVVRP